MDMHREDAPSLPATVVECPWCEAPVELDEATAALACPGCLVTVELAPDAGRRTTSGGQRLAA